MFSYLECMQHLFREKSWKWLNKIHVYDPGKLESRVGRLSETWRLILLPSTNNFASKSSRGIERKSRPWQKKTRLDGQLLQNDREVWLARLDICVHALVRESQTTITTMLQRDGLKFWAFTPILKKPYALYVPGKCNYCNRFYKELLLTPWCLFNHLRWSRPETSSTLYVTYYHLCTQIFFSINNEL